MEELIEACLNRKRPFVCHRMPEERTARLYCGEADDILLFSDWPSLNGKQGFLIAPFRIGPETPVVLARLQPAGEWTDSDGEAEETNAMRSMRHTSSPCTESYRESFDRFMNKLADGTFEKLVLSRRQILRRPPDFSPVQAFRKACRLYRHSYVYLCYTPQTGLWLGSTPETLLAGERNEWQTVALAGTQPLRNGRLPQTWSAKNQEEQEYVSDYIRSRLRSLRISAREEGPYSAYAGALAHLKTDFRFSLADNGRLGDLLELLHPTPAVCGLPKEEAYRFILDREGYDRRYYSGCIGWLRPDARTALFVNLRCMNIDSDTLTLYAGGGLIRSSETQDEWRETERKMQTMNRLIR